MYTYMPEQVSDRNKYTSYSEIDEALYADVENSPERPVVEEQSSYSRNAWSCPAGLVWFPSRTWSPNINSRKKGCCSLKMVNRKIVYVLAAVIVAALVVVIVAVVLAQRKVSIEDNYVANSSDTTSATILPTDSSSTILPDDLSKLECVAGTLRDNAELCAKRGCIWSPSLAPRVPQCLLPTTSKFGFKLANGSVPKTLDESEKVQLKVAKGSFFGPSFEDVEIDVQFLEANILRIKFLDKKSSRYEVPVDFEKNFATPAKGNAGYQVELKSNNDGIFSFQVIRRSSKTVIFDSDAGSLFLADRHIEVTTRLPTANVYGVGESAHRSFRHDLTFRKWPLFSRDQFPDPWDGEGNHNLYGVHPFYTCLEKNGNSHGVLFLNSNAMEITLTPMPALNFRSTGGILDMFFFLGENPEHVVQLYTQVVGRPLVPPYWSLGFQLSRYGFNSLANLEAAIKRTRDKNIPLDVVHGDIDHFENKKDFTWDHQRFPNFDQFVKDQKKEGLRFIVILDPALLADDPNYKQYKDGLDKDVFIKWPSSIAKEKRGNPPGVDQDKDIMFARVWPDGPVAFPDFFKERTRQWWTQAIMEYRAQVPFDAIWLDMNEPAVFGTDQADPWYCSMNESHCWGLKCPDNPWDSHDKTFYPAAASVHGPVKLSDKTLCMAAVIGEKDEYVHYNVHSIYGWRQAKTTFDALTASAMNGQPPFIVTRSTYPSSGKYSGHWLGDNKSRWEDLRASIIGMMEFNIFGIPYVGADICGFFLNSTAELCGRWMQAGAFYPFSRNHNTMGMRDQDPGNTELMRDIDISRAKTALDTRYQLLPYLHTLHYLAHLEGWTVVRPLFHEYSNDPRTYDIQTQFMWGSSLIISPALEENQSEIKLYLPDDVWYNFYGGRVVKKSSTGDFGTWIIEENTERVPLHVRGGIILPLKERGATNTVISREKKFELHIYPKDEVAKGLLYWTGEEAKNLDDENSYRVYSFDFKQDTLVIRIDKVGNIHPSNLIKIAKIFIYDQARMPESFKFQDVIYDQKYFDYVSHNKVTTIYFDIDLFSLTGTDSSRTLKITYGK